MKPTEILADCDRYLLGVADALYQLSTKFSIGPTTQQILLSHTRDLMQIQGNLKAIKNNLVAQETNRRKEVNAQYEKIQADSDLKKKQVEATRVQSLCKTCAHYKWVHDSKNPNQCGNKNSTCTCIKFVQKEKVKGK